MAVLRALGLAPVFAAGVAQASGDTLERMGTVLSAMKESVQTWRATRSQRPPLSAQARVAAAQKLAQSLAAQRDDLARRAPQLEAGSRFAADPGRFLERWCDEPAIRHLPLDASWGERLAIDLSGRWFQELDKRLGWKILFPGFRP